VLLIYYKSREMVVTMFEDYKKPLFITVDTEGDSLWDRPDKVTTENAKGIDRFQHLCEEHGVKPIYLTNFEMACDNVLLKSLKKKNEKNLCEIGMHMHAWNSPPIHALTDHDMAYLPFVTEYPADLYEEKVYTLKHLLEERFETKIVSHRSGRWAVDKKYLTCLAGSGIGVDCSYTPLIDWRCSMGAPGRLGGPDYRTVNPNIHQIGECDSAITEVPMTTKKNPLYNNPFVRTALRLTPESLRANKVYNAVNGRLVMMLRPDIRREKQQLSLINSLVKDIGHTHVELMVHSSEVFCGTCPHCKTEEDVDKLYGIMEKMFRKLTEFTTPKTFRELLIEQKTGEHL